MTAPMTAPMTWIKRGLAFAPRGDRDWALSHAAVPVCVPLDDRRVAVLYSARDAAQRSRPGRIVVDLATLAVVDDAPHSLLDLGPPGSFDDSGVMPCWASAAADGLRIYYIGWNKAVTVPFQNAIGLARADRAASTLTRVADGPIVARSRRDPYFVASCAVLPEGGQWRMWYLSCLGWDLRGNTPVHRYHIKTTVSGDGIDWPAPATVAIDFSGPGEYAISRPSVLVEGGRYHMWYSVRGSRYLIGYAQSRDGIVWTRRDDLVGLAPSAQGWDSEMICYPHVFRAGGRIYMAYNGNGYGRSGLGFAVLDGQLPTF